MAQGILYYLENTLELNLQDENPRVNVSMSNTQDINLYKGINNNIDFKIRNNERKRVLITDKTLVAHIVNVEDNILVLEKELTTANCAESYVRLHLTSEELNDLPTGDYSFTVTYSDIEGRNGILYSDRSSDAQCYFRLLEKVHPPAKPSIVIDQFDDDTHFYNLVNSHPAQGPGLTTYTGNIHSYAVYTDGLFTGKVTLQGSLQTSIEELEPGWFDIETLTFEPDSVVAHNATLHRQQGVLTNITDPHGVPEIGGKSNIRFEADVYSEIGLQIQPGEKLALVNDGNVYYVEPGAIYAVSVDDTPEGRRFRYSFPNVFDGKYKNSTPLYYEVGRPIVHGDATGAVQYGNFDLGAMWLRLVIDYETKDKNTRQGTVLKALIRL